jgi:hypothetical protein
MRRARCTLFRQLVRVYEAMYEAAMHSTAEPLRNTCVESPRFGAAWQQFASDFTATRATDGMSQRMTAAAVTDPSSTRNIAAGSRRSHTRMLWLSALGAILLWRQIHTHGPANVVILHSTAIICIIPAGLQ